VTVADPEVVVAVGVGAPDVGAFRVLETIVLVVELRGDRLAVAVGVGDGPVDADPRPAAVAAV
jgi:hypothetical protein